METTKMKKTQNLESQTMVTVADIVVEDENHGDVDDYILSGRFLTLRSTQKQLTA